MAMKLKGLAKLGEECSEVAQVVCKAVQVDGIDNDHWSGDLREMLENELGDLLAAINFTIDKNRLNTRNIQFRRDEKLSQFEAWDKE